MTFDDAYTIAGLAFAVGGAIWGTRILLISFGRKRTTEKDGRGRDEISFRIERRSGTEL